MTEESEPPIREFADRGTLWLLESPDNLHGLIRLLSREVADRLDFSKAERINRSFIPEDLQKQEADLLYRVPFREGKRFLWIYVLLEHQSKPDRTMGLRLLSYMLQIWQVQVRAWQDAKVPVSKWRLHPVVPVVFYTGKRVWSSPISLSALMEPLPLLERFVPQWETLFLKLQEMPGETLAAANSPIAEVLRALQVADASHATLARVLGDVVAHLDKLPEAEQAGWRRAMHYLYLLVRHKREFEEQESLFEIMNEAVERRAEEVEEARMTGAQVLLAQGRREGRKEGREEGRHEMLLEMLEAKFGVLSEELIAKVNALTDRQTKEMVKRVLAASTVAELGL